MEELRVKLVPLPPDTIARLLEALPPTKVFWCGIWSPTIGVPRYWTNFSDALGETLSLARRPVAGPAKPINIHAFEPHAGRLRQIQINSKDDLARIKPIWVDLLAPTREERQWVAEIFGLKLPDADDLTDLEESARFYFEDDDDGGDVHLHSDFLLEKKEIAQRPGGLHPAQGHPVLGARGRAAGLSASAPPGSPPDRLCLGRNGYAA